MTTIVVNLKRAAAVSLWLATRLWSALLICCAAVLEAIVAWAIVWVLAGRRPRSGSPWAPRAPRPPRPPRLR